MRIVPGLVAALIALASAGCSAEPDEPAPAQKLNPADRAVRIETTGCGFAPDRTGSGVAVGDGLVITVAHLVARADNIVAAVASEAPADGVVIAADLELDLALVRLPGNGAPAVETASADTGATGLIVGGATSGTIPFEVADVVRISIEEILGSDRHRRLGYELAAFTTTGDSGAGAYDNENRLIGIVFATSDDGATTWITSSGEIDRFLAAHDPKGAAIPCDEDASRLDL
jgi:S1-C subfamily serine protease